MSRWWAKLGAVVVVILVLGIALARIVAGTIVGSDDFREVAIHLTEQRLRPVLPQAMVTLERLALTGVATLELTNLALRSEKNLDLELHVPSVRLTPDLLSALTSPQVAFAMAVDFGGGGTMALTGQLPRTALIQRKAEGTLELAGKLSHIAAAPLASFWLAQGKGPNIQLADGRLSGTFRISKPLQQAGQRMGALDLQLDNSTWKFPGAGDEAELVVPTMPLSLAVKDYALTLERPVILPERFAAASLSGALVLPHLAGHEPVWDLGIVTTGPGNTSLARLLRCATPPMALRFHVSGPISGPHCEPE